MKHRTASLLLLATLAAPCHAGTNPRAQLTQLDGYGHFASADPALCTYAPIDVDGGTTLSPSASSPSAPALDDGGAAFALSQPFRFFGTDYNALVVSTNGYVAFAATLADENGGDFSNDLYLPAVPDNAPFAAARVLAYHDELSGEGAGAALTQQFFATCPRASGLVAGEACTVVRWKNWNRLGDTQPLTFQLVLYHASHAAVVQYTTLDATAGASACAGLQSDGAADGGAWSCNGTRVLEPGTALCLFDPDHLPSSNSDQIFTNGFEP